MLSLSVSLDSPELPRSSPFKPRKVPLLSLNAGFRPKGDEQHGDTEIKTFLLSCMLSSFQVCPTLCNPMDCSLPGSSVHRILQAKTFLGLNKTKPTHSSRRSCLRIEQATFWSENSPSSEGSTRGRTTSSTMKWESQAWDGDTSLLTSFQPSLLGLPLHSSPFWASMMY